jgi:hypothetical protein
LFDSFPRADNPVSERVDNLLNSMEFYDRFVANLAASTAALLCPFYPRPKLVPAVQNSVERAVGLASEREAAARPGDETAPDQIKLLTALAGLVDQKPSSASEGRLPRR